MNLHKTMASPVLAYESEVQTITESMRRKTETDRMCFLRSVVRIHSKTKTEIKISKINYSLIIFQTTK